MGRETVKKLQDIRGSAMAVGVEVNVPNNRIDKVGEFRRLALLAEADGHLRQKLQQVLKLSKEKWDEARDHAMRAVVADNRMRIWYADHGNMEVGLLFTCRLGTVELDRPVGLLTKKASDGAQTTMEATLMAQQTPVQRERVRNLQPKAISAWWQHGHPGWAIYPVDSDQFLATGALDLASLPMNDRAAVPLPGHLSPGGGVAMAGHVPAAAAHAAGYPFNAAFANAFAAANMSGSASGNALLRAMGTAPYFTPPFVPGAMPAGVATQALHTNKMAEGTVTTASPFAEAQAPGGQHTVPGGSEHQREIQNPNFPPATSAFASAPQLARSLENVPSLNIGNLQAMLGADFKLPFSMQGFPSLPPSAGLPDSGDLEQLLAQHGGGGAGDSFLPPPTTATGRFPSLALGKFGSFDLSLPPPAASGVASKDKNNNDNKNNDKNNNNRSGQTNPSAADGSNASRGLQRKHSGLESMQSIEQALQGVRRQDTMHDAIDAAVREVTRSGHTLSGTKRK